MIAKITKLSSHLGDMWAKRLANTKMLSKLSARIEQILQLHLANTLRKTLQRQIYYIYAAYYLQLGKISNCQLLECTRTNNLCSRFAKLMRCPQGFVVHNGGIKIRIYNASSIIPYTHLYICKQFCLAGGNLP